MRLTDLSRCLLTAALLLIGCDAGLEDQLGPDISPRTDAGTGANCPERQYRNAMGRCVEVPEDGEALCEFLPAQGFVCIDEDGDCFVSTCDSALPDDLWEMVFDEDDRRYDVHPGAVETCDGVDNDCDGETDEGFDIGTYCTNCRGDDGKIECAVNSTTASACSTAPGQSKSPTPELLQEICDGDDNDCDGITDEACRVDLPPADRHAPAICDDVLYFVEGNTIRAFEGGQASTVDMRGHVPSAVQALTCGGATLAWLEPDDPDDRCSSREEPITCDATLHTLSSHLNYRGLYGPPLISDGRVYWHTVIGEEEVVINWASSENLSDGDEFESHASDPTPLLDGRRAVRQWQGGEPTGTLMISEGTNYTLPVSSPIRFNERWVVWLEGQPAALWAAPHELRPGSFGEPFQITATDRSQHTAVLVDHHVFWLDGLDEAEHADRVRHFDLETGASTTLAEARVRRGELVADGDTLFWLAGDGAKSLFRHQVE